MKIPSKLLTNDVPYARGDVPGLLPGIRSGENGRFLGNSERGKDSINSNSECELGDAHLRLKGLREHNDDQYALERRYERLVTYTGGKRRRVSGRGD